MSTLIIRITLISSLQKTTQLNHATTLQNLITDLIKDSIKDLRNNKIQRVLGTMHAHMYVCMYVCITMYACICYVRPMCAITRVLHMYDVNISAHFQLMHVQKLSMYLSIVFTSSWTNSSNYPTQLLLEPVAVHAAPPPLLTTPPAPLVLAYSASDVVATTWANRYR